MLQNGFYVVTDSDGVFTTMNGALSRLPYGKEFTVVSSTKKRTVVILGHRDVEKIEGSVNALGFKTESLAGRCEALQGQTQMKFR